MKKNTKGLRSKQGFTLVELMIVVVIMGILVAVAIPVYQSLTGKAKATACHANCEAIEKASLQYIASADPMRIDFVQKNQPLIIQSQTDATEKLPEAYLACFSGGKFPECPCGSAYKIYYNEANDGLSVSVYCTEHGDIHGENP